MKQECKNINRKNLIAIVIAIVFFVMSTSTISHAGTITASDHWVLTPIGVTNSTGFVSMWYAGAAGYTTSSSYHRTTAKYYYKWDDYITKSAPKWGKGKVSASTGYLERYKCNVKNGFQSKVFYYFPD